MALWNQFIAGLCLLSTFAVFADCSCAQSDTANPSQDVTAAEIETLLTQLESDSYLERQRASNMLARSGVDAAQQVVERLLNGPPETAARCTRLLSQIALGSDEQDMTRIARILLVLSQNGFEHLRGESLHLNTRWKQAQVDRTVQKLKDAGIGIDTMSIPGFGRVGGLTVIDSFDSNGPDPWLPETQSTRQSDSQTPKLSTDELLARVDQIIAATEEQNNESFAHEITSNSETENGRTSAQTLAQAGLGTEVVMMGGEARILVRGDRGLIAIDGRTLNGSDESTPVDVTINDQFKGTVEDLQLLGLLPSIAQLTISEREIDENLMEMLRSTPSINYVSFDRCTYDLAKVFAIMKERPNLRVSATGHDSFLGVQLQTDTTEDGTQSCRILEVVADTAAEDAGCKNGDTIRKLNDVSVNTYEQLILAIGSFKPGDEITLDILRGEEELEFKVKLRSRPPGQ